MRPKFYTYLLTNWAKTVLYAGFTNNLAERVIGHWIGNDDAFTTQYKVHHLVWYEETKYVLNAIDFEKKLKHYTREQKEALIATVNPTWRFLNADIVGNWPPTQEQIDAVKEKWKADKDSLRE